MKMTTKMIINAARKLPPFPQAAQKVLDLLDDPDVGVDKLVDVVEMDPNLTISVLRAVNSPMYGLVNRVDNLPQALALIGNIAFAEIVFTTAAAFVLGDEQTGYELDRGDLWKHSLSVAYMTKILCAQIGHKPGPALYTAALLHDIGKVVISTFVEAKYQEIKKLVKKGRPFLEAERDVLGLDHAELGGVMAQDWRFSEDMIKLIRSHHQPSAEPDWIDLALLYTANVACQMIGLGGGADGVSPQWDQAALKLIGLTEGQLMDSMADLQIKLNDAESILGLGG